MQDDIFPAAEKILSDIENVVKKDQSLKSFEIIPAEDTENKSPVFHQEECLGLASWCVQPLYCYVYRRLFELRQNKHRREEPSTISRWLLGALLLNPNVTTFWNMRRELVKSHKLEPSEEFSFTQLILYYKPKCFEAFAYRRWLLSYILDSKDKLYNPGATESPLCTELDIASTCADRYANNYHAWSHRRHVMTLRESRGFSYPNLDTEWKNSLAWCQRHISDYSGLSYRQFLLRKYMLESRDVEDNSWTKSLDAERREELFAYIKSNIGDTRDAQKLQRLQEMLNRESGGCSSSREEQTCYRGLSYWAEECCVNENIICMYNDHEALWYHRRFLAYLLTCFTTTNRKRTCYKDEISDRGNSIRVEDSGNSIRESSLTTNHEFIVEAFRTRTEKIAELAMNRDQHEKILVERFLEFLRSIGFQIRS